METLEPRLKKFIDGLTEHYPELAECSESITQAFVILRECYSRGGKLLIAGNGGSAADAEHITGELMKRFKLPRPVSPELRIKMIAVDAVRGSKLSESLERGLMTIPLTAHESLSTAFINDVGADGMFAQQRLGYGQPGDVFLGISTSGNSENVVNAAVVAKALQMKVIALTGHSAGTLGNYADTAIKVPQTETYLIQELHLPVYHCLCLMLEEAFFGFD